MRGLKPKEVTISNVNPSQIERVEKYLREHEAVLGVNVRLKSQTITLCIATAKAEATFALACWLNAEGLKIQNGNPWVNDPNFK